ncbi:MAG: L,D-transpeptidase [Odoribacter sp.]
METEILTTEEGKPKKDKGMSYWLVAICILCLLVFIVMLPIYITPVMQNVSFGKIGKRVVDSTLLVDKEVQKELSSLKAAVSVLDRKLDAFLPHTAYIVINTTKNKFYLFNNKGNLVREGFCSSGSYTKLVSEKRSWMFKTPRGRMTVLSKTENPVWSKPDWAFIEEGLPVPKAGDPSRYERGVLGDYALRMADGYLLHGTLYQRLLGMPVTHGCIRLGDEDLDVVYHTLSVGAYVYIY